jgi:hypothetical protein
MYATSHSVHILTVALCKFCLASVCIWKRMEENRCKSEFQMLFEEHFLRGWQWNLDFIDPCSCNRVRERDSGRLQTGTIFRWCLPKRNSEREISEHFASWTDILLRYVGRAYRLWYRETKGNLKLVVSFRRVFLLSKHTIVCPSGTETM